MRRGRARLVFVAALFACLLAAPAASAYSVLAHEAMVDAVWTEHLAATLITHFQRPPNALNARHAQRP